MTSESVQPKKRLGRILYRMGQGVAILYIVFMFVLLPLLAFGVL